MDLNLLFKIVLLVSVVALYYWSKNRKRRAQQVAAKMDIYKLDRSPELARLARDGVFGDQDPERVDRMFDQYCFLFAQNGSFAPNPEPAIIQQLVRSVFPSGHQESVLATLDQYGEKKYEVERARVQLDIVKASGGDHTKVTGLVNLAKRDFRDVVGMAEYPAFHSAIMQGSPAAIRTVIESSTHEHRNAADADLRQFGMWLLQYVE